MLDFHIVVPVLAQWFVTGKAELVVTTVLCDSLPVLAVLSASLLATKRLGR